MVEQTSDQGQKFLSYVNEHFYAEYLEGLKGKFAQILTLTKPLY